MTDNTQRCPTCGAAVRVVSSGEGTNYYKPAVDADSAQLAMRCICLERVYTAIKQLQVAQHALEQARLQGSKLADKLLLDTDVARAMRVLEIAMDKVERASANR